MTFPFKISNGEGGRGGPFKPDANYYNYDVAEKYSLVRISHQLPTYLIFFFFFYSLGLQGKNAKNTDERLHTDHKNTIAHGHLSTIKLLPPKESLVTLFYGVMNTRLFQGPPELEFLKNLWGLGTE
jgi:hypothetical protein